MVGLLICLCCQIEKTSKINYYTLVKISKILKTTPEKIELYEQSLSTNDILLTDSPPQTKLPELEYLRMENQFLKEQIVLLKKNVILLESKI